MLLHSHLHMLLVNGHRIRDSATHHLSLCGHIVKILHLGELSSMCKVLIQQIIDQLWMAHGGWTIAYSTILWYRNLMRRSGSWYLKWSG